MSLSKSRTNKRFDARRKTQVAACALVGISGKNLVIRAFPIAKWTLLAVRWAWSKGMVIKRLLKSSPSLWWLAPPLPLPPPSERWLRACVFNTMMTIEDFNTFIEDLQSAEQNNKHGH